MQKPWKVAVYWLILHGFLSLLSFSTQNHQPRGSTGHSFLSPPASIVSLENVPHICPQVNFGGGIFSIEVPSSQMRLTCIKLTKNQSGHLPVLILLQLRQCEPFKSLTIAHKVFRGDVQEVIYFHPEVILAFGLSCHLMVFYLQPQSEELYSFHKVCLM